MIPSRRSLLSRHGFSQITEEKYLKPEKSWKLLEHTADIRLEVYGATLEDLFINAALGFSNSILPEAELTSQTELEINVEADSAEELLVNWLRELLFLNQTRKLIMTHVQMIVFTETNLLAKVSFTINPPDVESSFEIKGVTYHGLSIVKNSQGYSARIVFDI
ncbi:MAG: archease [Desulfomonilaceae bacterium]